MKRILFLVLFNMVFLVADGQVKVRFELLDMPKATEVKPAYFVAGNFNSWSPNDANSQLVKTTGSYVLEKSLPLGNYEFKITRGDWSKVESASSGQAIANRSFTLKKDTLIRLNVAAWADAFKKEAPQSTATTNVHLLDSAFEMPQLHNKRSIWIYLPPSYAKSKQKYPVLYMHDGQNVFDQSTAGFGEWGVDEILDSLIAKGAQEYIVVAVANGGSERLKEYNLYDSQYGKGKGKAYVAFLAETLKPYIDQHYRTLRDSKHTAIAGSSMGGLISMYAMAAYPNVYGKAGIFSPAFWLGKAIETDIKNAGVALKGHQVYLVAGALEGTMMTRDMESVYQVLLGTEKEQLLKAGKDVKLVEKADGKHREWFWRREFPAFYEFIAN
ncbi:alpha/beta hydrolase-fold protein [Pedobacter sp. ASV12]|uniref:alpha/beta hydrolase-fold protein n=1 Tax=Pedobacter sp. ASV12 TaxID=2795120 RepID=UPI0018ECB81E|nr:alpha/beta hydrolase-fold protein [Pedobacter sp. ASV12]